MDIFEAVINGDTAYVKDALDKKEAAVNAKQPGTNKTLLMLAVENAQIPMVNLLIKEGAEVGYADLEYNNVLINAKNLKPENSELVSIVQQAINDDLVEILKHSQLDNDQKIGWLSYWDDLAFDYKVLLNAIWAKLPEDVILEFISQANIVADFAVSELFRNTLSSEYSAECKIAIIKLLIKNGMDLNTKISGRGYYNNTPLDLVMRSENINKKTSLELSKILLDAGANPNISFYDKRPLMVYCGDLDKTKLLLAAGADPLLVTDKDVWVARRGLGKYNSLDYAYECMKYECMKYELQDSYNSNSRYKPSVKLMAQAAALKLYGDNDPIMAIVVKGQLENIKMLPPPDPTGWDLYNRSNKACLDLEESVKKALEVDEFLKKYDSNEPQITTYLKELQTALQERLSEKEAPKKGWFSWLGAKDYKPLSSVGGEEDEGENRRNLTEAKQNPRNKS